MPDGSSESQIDRYRISKVWIALVTLQLVSLLVAPFTSYKLDVDYYWLNWARATQGGSHPWGMYAITDKGMTCNYPPVITYLLAAADFCLTRFRLGYRSTVVLIKLPNILAHLGGVVVCAALLKPWLGRRGAVLTAIAYAASLPLFLNAAWWGQYDVLLALPMLAAVLLLILGRPAAAGACFGAAMAIKLQAVVILPVLAVYAVRRVPLRKLDLRPLVVAAAASLAAWGALSSVDLLGRGPGAGPYFIHEAYFGAVDRFPEVSIGAYNTWQLLIQYRMRVEHENKFVARSDRRPMLPKLPPKRIGLLSFIGYTLLTCALLYKRPTPRQFLMASVCLTFAFFMLPTQIHERYVIPAVALATPLAFIGEAALFVGLSITTLANQARGLFMGNREFAGLTNSASLVRVDSILSVIFSTLNVILFLWATWRFVRSSLTTTPATGEFLVDAGSAISHAG